MFLISVYLLFNDGASVMDFEQLYSNFGRDLDLAKKLDSPNLEDTLQIRAAIVGFSYHAATELWGIDEYTYVARRLSAVENYSQPEAAFFAIAIGYLLGLARLNKIEVKDFKLALVQLPGFILLKGGKF